MSATPGGFNPLSPLPMSPNRAFRDPNAPLLSSVARNRADDSSMITTSQPLSTTATAITSPAQAENIAPLPHHSSAAAALPTSPSTPSVVSVAATSKESNSNQQQTPLTTATNNNNNNNNNTNNASPNRQQFSSQLRAFFLYYCPAMCQTIDQLVRQHSHEQEKLWRVLERKYGPRSGIKDTKTSKTALRGELIRYFRLVEPSLEPKVDDIITAVADDESRLWVSLEAKFGVPRSMVQKASSKRAGDLAAEASASVGDFATEQTLSMDATMSGPGGAPEDDDEEHHGLPMDLGSRLRRFFEAHDKSKLARVDEMVATYKNAEKDLAESLQLLYDAELEAPPGGFQETASAAQLAALTSAKRLRLSRGQLAPEDAERWLTAWATRYAPEKLGEVELIATRWQGRETEMRETLESMFGPVSFRHIPAGPSLAEQRALERKCKEEEAKKEPPEVRIKRVALEQRLQRFFEAHDKKMVKKCGDMAAKFLNHEAELFERLVKKFGREPLSGPQLEDMTRRVERFYHKWQPELVADVPAILHRHAGHEYELVATLTRKYGPEPPADDIAQQRMQAHCYAKLEAYLRFFDPTMLPTAPNIFEKFSKAGRERELVAALHQVYGLLPAQADPTIEDASLALPENDIVDGDEQQDENKKNVKWTRTGVPETDSAFIKMRNAEIAHSQTLDAVDPAAIKPDETTKRRLLSYLAYYAPERVNDINHIFAVFGGREEELFEVLKKRFGPEPKLDNAYSKAALEESAKKLRSLFGRYYQHYDPSKMWEIDALIPEYLGRIEDARRDMLLKYGPEPRYSPLAADLRLRLIRFFRYYDPPQLANVDTLSEAYLGMDDELFELLTTNEQYGPEPPDNSCTPRHVFKARLARYFKKYPECQDEMGGSFTDLDKTALEYEDFQDELFLSELIPRFGAEPPDPEAEARLRQEQMKVDMAKRALRQQLDDFFEVYAPEQMGENAEVLADSYWNQPDVLMQQLYDAYGVETETITEQPTQPFAEEPDDDEEDEKKYIPPPKPEQIADATLWERVTRMYQMYKPDSLQMLPALAKRYEGREEEILDALVAKYGPEPPADWKPPERKKEEKKKPEPPQPKTIVRPTMTAEQQQQRIYDNKNRIDPVERCREILEHYAPHALHDLPRMLERYRGAEAELQEVLEEKYELRPGTLVPWSQELRAEDLLRPQEREAAAQRQREAEEAARRRPAMPMRERCKRMYQWYDVPAIRTLDLDLQRCGGDEAREEQYLQSLVAKYGPEPGLHDDTLPHRYRLRKYYTQVCPENLPKIDEALQRFKGREMVLFKAMLTKYQVPEPADPEILPPISEEVLAYRRSVKQRVAGIYAKFNPAKLEELDSIMERYTGHEENLLEQLEIRYRLGVDDLAEDKEKMSRVRDQVSTIYKLAGVERDAAAVEGLLLRYRNDLTNLLDQVRSKYPEAWRDYARGVREPSAAAAASPPGSPAGAPGMGGANPSFAAAAGGGGGAGAGGGDDAPGAGGDAAAGEAEAGSS